MEWRKLGVPTIYALLLMTYISTVNPLPLDKYFLVYSIQISGATLYLPVGKHTPGWESLVQDELAELEF